MLSVETRATGETMRPMQSKIADALCLFQWFQCYVVKDKEIAVPPEIWDIIRGFYYHMIIPNDALRWIYAHQYAVTVPAPVSAICFKKETINDFSLVYARVKTRSQSTALSLIGTDSSDDSLYGVSIVVEDKHGCRHLVVLRYFTVVNSGVLEIRGKTAKGDLCILNEFSIAMPTYHYPVSNWLYLLLLSATSGALVMTRDIEQSRKTIYHIMEKEHLGGCDSKILLGDSVLGLRYKAQHKFLTLTVTIFQQHANISVSTEAESGRVECYQMYCRIEDVIDVVRYMIDHVVSTFPSLNV